MKPLKDIIPFFSAKYDREKIFEKVAGIKKTGFDHEALIPPGKYSVYLQQLTGEIV